MVPRLHPHLFPVKVMAFHFHLRPGLVILQLAVPLVTVTAGSPAGFPRRARAMETGSRPVAAAVSFVARSSPALACFALVPCRWPIGFGIADLVIAAADPFSLAGSDLAAVVGFAGFAAGSVVVGGGLSVAVDSAATVFVAVAPDLACSVVGSVCSFAAETGKERAVVGISCFLTPRSSF